MNVSRSVEREVESHIFRFSRFDCIEWLPHKKAGWYRLRMYNGEDDWLIIEIEANCPRLLWLMMRSALRSELWFKKGKLCN